MALTRRQKRDTGQQSFRIADTITLAVGGYVAIATASGDAVAVADTVGHVPAGFVIGFDPPDEKDGALKGDTSLAKPPEAIVDIRETIVRNATVVGVTGQADVGEEVFATGVDTFTLTPTVNIKAVGKVVRFHSGTTVDVLFYSLATIAAK